MSDAPIYEINVIDFKKDPYPDLKEMRASTPICFVPQLNATMICERDSIFECEKNTKICDAFCLQSQTTKKMRQKLLQCKVRVRPKYSSN